MNHFDLPATRRNIQPWLKPTTGSNEPPCSEEAEMGVLGCCLMDPSIALNACIELFGAGEGVFHLGAHQLLWTLLCEMDTDRLPIDIITVRQQLKDKNQLEMVGGVSYLNDLLNRVPSAANWSYYAEIVREKHLLRGVQALCQRTLVKLGAESADKAEEIMEEFEREALAIRGTQLQAETEIKTVVRASVAAMQEAVVSGGALSGRVLTGLFDLDRIMRGMAAQNLIVIAARPALGKTSLAMNIAERVAVTDGQPVAVFSLEMSSQELIERMICSRARVDSNRVLSGLVNEGELKAITNAAIQISKAPLHIVDTGGLSISQLRARARRLHQRHKLALVIVDYLQLVRGINRKGENRTSEITDVSNGLKSMAKELGIPVLALAQLNRDNDKHERAPRLSDLRDSGSIEQDADKVILLHRPEPKTACKGVQVIAHVAKHRGGPTGVSELIFLPELTRFESAARVAAEDCPSTSIKP